MFANIWQGRIPLWKAFWLVHIGGLVFSLVVGILPQAFIFMITETRLPQVVAFIPYAILMPITWVCLLRSAARHASGTKRIFVHVWVSLAILYYVFLIGRNLLAPW